MIKIAFITPDPNMIDLVKRTYEEHAREYAKTSGDRHEYGFTVYSAPLAKDVDKEVFAADILIARGLFAEEFRRMNPGLVVVEVPISNEMISIIYKGISKFGRQPVAVAGSFNMIFGAQGIGDVLGVDVKTYLQTSNEQGHLEELADTMKADGRKLVVCGVNMHRVATAKGFQAMTVFMSRESIWQAISEAKHGAVIKHKERERAEQFRTVLNYAYEGVLATDIQGNVTVFNAAAADILQVPAAEAIGKHLDYVAPRGHLNSVLRGKSDYTDKIIPHKGELLSVNKVSVVLGEDFSGHVITMQKSSLVQKTESKFRQQLYAKGHIARYGLDDITGTSAAIRSVVGKARNFASVTSNILIIGETGTGKEMFAQGIHNESARKNAPFVAINCAALSKSLLESELFGYVEGAFTGAAKGGKPGIFEIAHTGTIFLDEISEIPLDLQGRLLRVLQERQIMRLGDDKIIPIDVRIISASNKPLLSEVRQNAFRRDLYYRLNVLTLHLPNLNERETDILRLAQFFLEEYCDRFQKPPVILSDAACSRLMRHRWEGNIRELRNVCECLVVLNSSGVLTDDELAEVLDESEVKPKNGAGEGVSYADELRKFDRERIMQALQAHKGDKAGAAKKLGISKTTLWRRMKTLSIEM